MLPKRLLSLVGLLAFASGHCVAMQQQQQQVQKPQDQHQHHDHQPTNPDKNDAPVVDATQTDLAAQLQALLDNVNKTHGSVGNMIKQKMKDHPRICPTCGGLAVNCPADRARLAEGNVMKCGCDMCGGRQY